MVIEAHWQDSPDLHRHALPVVCVDLAVDALSFARLKADEKLAVGDSLVVDDNVVHDLNDCGGFLEFVLSDGLVNNSSRWCASLIESPPSRIAIAEGLLLRSAAE